MADMTQKTFPDTFLGQISQRLANKISFIDKPPLIPWRIYASLGLGELTHSVEWKQKKYKSKSVDMYLMRVD